jgi:hypothetical protein
METDHSPGQAAIPHLVLDRDRDLLTGETSALPEGSIRVLPTGGDACGDAGVGDRRRRQHHRRSRRYPGETIGFDYQDGVGQTIRWATVELVWHGGRLSDGC